MKTTQGGQPTSELRHPFSSTVKNNFIYDFYLEDSIAACFSNAVGFIPAKTSIHCSNTAREPSDSPIWMIQNVPSYLEITKSELSPKWGRKEIKQYKGYALRLSDYTSADAFIGTQLSSRNRRKLRSKLGKLEKTGKIEYHFYYGSVSWSEHVERFDKFYDMLKRRFDEIKLSNRNLFHWAFFCMNSYQLIIEKRAFLFVVEKDGVPIAFSLNYLRGNLCFGIFQTHDIQYNAFNLGDICMLKKLEWFYGQGVVFYDLSMGLNYFKEKWADYEYTFYHILFHRYSFPGRSKAFFLENALRFRQWLRYKGIIGNLINLDKLLYNRNARKLESFDWKSGLENN